MPQKKKTESTAANPKTTAKKPAGKRKPAAKRATSKASPAAKSSAKKTARKPRVKARKPDLSVLKDARRYRGGTQKRVGMLFSGGPAPGANAVISTAAIQFLNAGYEVIGFFKGYEFLEEFDYNNPRSFQEGVHYMRMSYDDVTKIRQVGGCVLRTSRANPSRVDGRDIKTIKDLANPKIAVKLYNILDAFEYLGISSLISIGGDDTLKTGYYLNLLGVPVIHVPKTIDNDYFGIPWTFGYFSAIERARQDLKVYNQEVQTTECYFVLELMGRKAGWYTLGAGIAGEAVRMIGPEEVPDNLDINVLADELVDLILKREIHNKRYGVILVSEGLVDKLPPDQKPVMTDQHGNIMLGQAKIGEHLTETLKKRFQKRTNRSITIKHNRIGYATRCVEPSAFDVLLGSQLGMGAFKFTDKRQFGCMVSVGDNLEIKKVAFGELIDFDSFKTRLRYVPMDGDFFKLAKSLEFKGER